MGTFVPPGSQQQPRGSFTVSMDDSVHSATSASTATSPTSGGAKVYDAGPSGSGAASHLLDNVTETLMFWNAKIRYELIITYDITLSQPFFKLVLCFHNYLRIYPFFTTILSAPQIKGRLWR